jgi:hypothetical protein
VSAVGTLKRWALDVDTIARCVVLSQASASGSGHLQLPFDGSVVEQWIHSADATAMTVPELLGVIQVLRLQRSTLGSPINQRGLDEKRCEAHTRGIPRSCAGRRVKVLALGALGTINGGRAQRTLR